MATTPEDLEFTIARLHLEPDDVLVAQFKMPVHRDVVERAYEILRKATHHSHILLLESGLDLSVLTRGEIDRRAS